MSGPDRQHPRVLGTPAGGLEDSEASSWLAPGQHGAARAGAIGERLSAAALDALAARGTSLAGVTVMHDVMVPSQRYRANIDHLVVCGDTVHLIDSKRWKPGIYWTLGGRSFRGLSRFTPAEHRTMGMAADAVRSYLTRRDIKVELVTPTVVVWPSSDRSGLNTTFLRFPGAEVIAGRSLDRFLRRSYRRGSALADPQIVEALSRFLVTPQHSALAGPSRHGAPVEVGSPVLPEANSIWGARTSTWAVPAEEGDDPMSPIP